MTNTGKQSTKKSLTEDPIAQMLLGNLRIDKRDRPDCRIKVKGYKRKYTPGQLIDAIKNETPLGCTMVHETRHTLRRVRDKLRANGRL